MIGRVAGPLVLALGLVLGCAAAEAFEVWLEPVPLQPLLGTQVDLRLGRGPGFPEGDMPFRRAHVARFEFRTALGTSRLMGHEGARPAATVAMDEPLTGLAVLTTEPQTSALNPMAFRGYAEREGYPELAAEVAPPGRRAVVRERAIRYTKTLVVPYGMPGNGSAFGRKVDQRLEILPRFDPGLTAAFGGPLEVEVRFDGRLHKGAQVQALPRNPDGTVQTGTTDENGRVVLVPDAPGAWLIRTVHLQICYQCRDAEVESFWSTFFVVVGKKP